MLFVHVAERYPQLATLSYPLPMPGTQEEGRIKEKMEADKEEENERE